MYPLIKLRPRSAVVISVSRIYNVYELSLYCYSSELPIAPEGFA